MTLAAPLGETREALVVDVGQIVTVRHGWLDPLKVREVDG